MATDYTKTQRIVLLIDLNPLLHLQDPEPYLITLLASAKTLISFPPLRSSLFSFKPFFSSLSPLLSSSKLPSSLSLSFDRPDTIFESLKSLLLNPPALKYNCSNTKSFLPRGLNVAASMRQLIHDYAWDLENFCGSVNDGNILDGPVWVRSNLVVLFSPVVDSVKCLSEFVDVEVHDECLSHVGLFKGRFGALFESVRDAFCSKDIHFSWVDVKCDLGLELESSSDANVNKFAVKNGYFERGIRDLGWGFCSSDSVVLGSSLLHFGLIYPRIGVALNLFDNDNDNDSCKAMLNLEILDVSGKPLECKCCHLKLVDMEKNRFRGLFGDGIVKLSVKAVYRCEEAVKLEGKLMDPILVCECFGESEKDEKDSDFFACRVLKILAREMGESVRIKGTPIWQILLSFLYRKGYWALISFLDSKGESHMGVLKPFTVFLALLSIIDDKSYPPNNAHEIGGENLSPFVKKMDNDICKSNMSAVVGEVKRRKHKKDAHFLHDLTWNNFNKAAFESTVIELEEVYFTRECNSSKKLKFLKCWMKQIEKSNSLMINDQSKPNEGIPREQEHGLSESPEESERPIPLSVSVGDESSISVSRIQDDAAVDVRSETSESFFRDLTKKIQQGLESEGVDLGTLAQRLVNSSIYWLCQKHEMEDTLVSQTPGVKSGDASADRVVVELTKLLLKEPKDLIATHKKNNPPPVTPNPSPTGFASENIVREYELQILFRMEILQSEAGASIEEPLKQKFVKQICLLLEAIQCHLEGGFFGDWSLDNYVGDIIKSRYGDSLEDVVHRIYTKMDLFLFADEDEPSNHMLNSEESSQSWMHKQPRDEKVENSRVNESVSMEDESHWLQENDNDSPQGIKREEQARKVKEAQERRERARRFASFTSWMPDLQRVWALKQPKASKPNSNRKLSRWKDRKRANYDKVCETPMTGTKRSCSHGYSSTDEEALQDSATRFSGSVSKALFQDDQ